MVAQEGAEEPSGGTMDIVMADVAYVMISRPQPPLSNSPVPQEFVAGVFMAVIIYSDPVTGARHPVEARAIYYFIDDPPDNLDELDPDKLDIVIVARDKRGVYRLVEPLEVIPVKNRRVEDILEYEGLEPQSLTQILPV